MPVAQQPQQDPYVQNYCIRLLPRVKPRNAQSGTATGDVKRYVNRIHEDDRYVETWLPTEVTALIDAK